jgi:hypothetical protein
MKMQTMLRGTVPALVILATTTVSISQAVAQSGVVPGTPIGDQPPPPSLNNVPLGRALDDRILVRGTPREVGQETSPEAAGYMRHTDRHTEITRREWVAAGRSEAQFDQIRQRNYGLCLRTTMYIFRLERLGHRYRARYGQVDAMHQRFIDLGGNIRSADRARTGGNVLSVLLGFATGGLGYAGVVGGGAIGNEAQGRAWTQSMLVNRDAGILNNELTRDHIDFSLLSVELHIDYLEMVADYCGEFLGRVAVPVNFAAQPQPGYGAIETRVTYGREEHSSHDRRGGRR